ncbi:DUF6644 family protein [Actinomadura rugatobispora]|uniref:DUF6644 family protein n=1 Tax=Actinomadura rugatobispora TaxID=1994 RepID=A0ABW1A8M0_9ACTN|nr:hypothetical protein GCM10010200_039410 [Actinomadura rugatobispora]
MNGVLSWLEATGPATFIRDGRWAYPLTESAHLIGLALMFGAIAVFDLRLLGFSRRVPVSGLAAQALPWARRGFVLVALSGALLFSANATQVFDNTAFQVKLLLIGAAGLNIFVFHTGVFRDVKDWDTADRAPAAARAAAALSLAIWPAVIVCGRLIAYA